MTRRDYILIAEVIRQELELCDNREQVDVVESIRDRMAIALGDDNHRFNATTFKEACEL